MKRKYDIFLVDADGTLLDSHASSLASLTAASKAFKREWKEEYEEEFFSLNDELWQKLVRKEITRERLLSSRFPEFLDRVGEDDIPGDKFNE